MGWMIVLFLPTLLKNAGMEFLFWLILGGLFYTIGAVIYAKKSFKYYHFVWHMFINFAAVSQFIAFVFYLN
jgi:hemolysin III